MKQRFLKAAGAMLLLFAATVSSYGQYLGSTPPDAKMLPNASSASSAMSSIHSPSLFDGTANITIPIYNYDNYGVSLTYNTKGILLDEVSSNAGLHWNIVAEPSIERTVKGFPDEFTYKTAPSTNLQVGANQYYSKFHGRLAASFETGSQQTDPETFRDEESDEFHVTLGGTSFSFVMGKNRGIYTIPYKNITVTLLSNGVPYESVVHGDTLPDPLSMQFKITDEQGNSYLFVKGNYVHSSITYSQVGRQNALLEDPTIGDPQYMINRWVVKDITLADGRKIHYNYTQTWEGSADGKSWLGYDWGSSSKSAEPDRVADIYNWISDITYPNNTKVTFIYDTQHRRCDWGYATSGSPTNYPLSEIQVGSATSPGNCLRYKLYQHYDVTAADNTFQTVPEAGPCASMSSGGNSAAYRAHRLILDSLNLLSCDGTAQEPYYAFTYNGVHMPWRFRGGRDWFGYYNGKSPGGSDPDLSVPYHTPNSDPSNPNPTTYGIDRSSDINYMQAGILTSVRNASGGVVGFVYEAHSGLTNAYGSLPASDPFFMAANADDGLRLHFINETDPFNAYGYRVTEFTYAGGQRFLPGGYFHSPYSSDALGNTTINLIFSNNFLTAHQMVNGANHGYSTVTVTTKNSGGQQLSKKIVTFTNIQDATVSQPRYYRSSGSKQFFEFPYTDKQYLRDWELGLPLTESEYDNLNNLQQVTTNRYDFQLDATSATSEFGNTKKSFVVTDKNQYIYTAPSNGLGTGSMFYPCTAITDDYMPYRGKSLLLSTAVKKYVNATSFIPDSTTYTYDDHDNLKTISTWNSKGEEIQTINYYNYDIQAASGGSFSPLTGLEKLVATQRWKRLAGASGSLPENGVLLDGYFTAYTAQGGIGSYTNIRNQALYNLRSGIPLTYSQYLGSGSDNTTAKKVQAAWSGLNISGYRNTSNVTLFDVKGNPLETQLLGLDQYKAMIWDTVSGQKLAEAANCRYSDIAYSSFEYQYDIYNSNTNLGYINGPSLFSTDHVTGSRSLILGTATSVVGTRDLSPGKEYILSFWCQGSNPAVSIGSTAISLPASPAAQKGAWNNYIVRFTPSGTGQRIRISGTASNCALDEVRLHPASAVMQSWTYMPLYGMSSATDATGRITYYEYDPMGRRNLVRDQEGNILQKTQYTIGGADQ